MPSETRTEPRPHSNVARVVAKVVTGTYIVFAVVHLLRDIMLR